MICPPLRPRSKQPLTYNIAMAESKTALRAQLKQVRLTLSDAEHTLKSRAIATRLKTAINWSDVKTVHYFEPIHELLEVDISDLVTYLEDTYLDIELFTPRLINREWQMISAQEGHSPKKFDVIIVPMLGFDPETLQRIGYGGGYYDRFLATQPQAKKIGVCFEVGKVEKIPAEPHDIKLDKIFTENSTYS